MKTVDENSFQSLELSRKNSRLEWSETGRRRVCDTPVFSVDSVSRSSTDGRNGDFTVVNSRNWVNVIPVFTGTDGKKHFVMERQFRHGSGEVDVEFPGGIIEKGEKPEEAALRELKEETGIVAGKLTFLGDINPNAAFIHSRGYIFLAENLENTDITDFDENEQIDVVTIPEDEVLNSIGKNEFDNGGLLISLCFYMGFNRKKMF